MDISERLEAVQSQISDAAKQSGRTPDAVTLVAVTKTHPPETIMEACDAGQWIFGENRVQEGLAKIPLLPGRCQWHLIGHLQKNKIRKALPAFVLIHGVDSLELAQNINRIAEELGLFPHVLLEVNVAGEASKFGFKPEDVEREWDALATLDRLQIDGLMGMAPIVEDPEDARPYFAHLRNIRDRLAVHAGCPLSTLSMGMSGDFPQAILEGATMVRVGSAIFGHRKTSKKN